LSAQFEGDDARVHTLHLPKNDCTLMLPNPGYVGLWKAAGRCGGSGRAHYELGVALAQSGDSTGAIQHLRAAARDTDPNISAAANEMLRRIGPR
jgi:hypothetical protein